MAARDMLERLCSNRRDFWNTNLEFSFLAEQFDSMRVNIGKAVTKLDSRIGELSMIATSRAGTSKTGTSILIPAHNEAGYLPACLAALIASDTVDGVVEVIVIAASSQTDGTEYQDLPKVHAGATGLLSVADYFFFQQCKHGLVHFGRLIDPLQSCQHLG